MAKIDAKPVYDRAIHGRLLNPKAASEYLESEHSIIRSVKRLADMRVKNFGPEFVKQSRHVFYPEACLDSWANIVNGVPLTRSSKREVNKVARAVAHADGLADAAA